jgi:Ca-activated chloride channel family protein
LQGNKIETGMMLYEGKDENFFLLMLQPPKNVRKENIPPREYLFIMDVSGSMSRYRLDISKQLLRNLILRLNPKDKFNVLFFSNDSDLLSDHSLNVNRENIDRAVKFIDERSHRGETKLLKALERAFSLKPPDPSLLCTFVVVTDGLVYADVENEVFAFIRKNIGNSNLFSFGIGRDVNCYLTEGMAFLGNGESMLISQPESVEKQAGRFRNYINTPVMTQIKTNFGDFKTYDVESLTIPDMLAERPVIIFGKYKGKPAGTVTLSGKTGQKTFQQTFDLSAIKPDTAYSALRYLWVRERIKYLDYMTSETYPDYDSPENDERMKKIIALGFQYNLKTNYTSFIAIDERTVKKGEKRVTVKQSIPMPQPVWEYIWQ